MSTARTPSRGEIWLVDFDPTVGSEIGKRRPAVVVNPDSVGRLPLRIVVPITDWKPTFIAYPWMIELPADEKSGLVKPSSADAFQTKSISLQRFARRLGRLSESRVQLIAAGVALCAGWRQE